MPDAPDLKHLPHSPGVYLMRDNLARILYVGKAKDLKKRVSSYFQARPLENKILAMVSLVRHIDYVAAASEREALILEQKLIRRLQPFYNTLWRDDKSYPYLKLSTNEDFPRLFLTRRKLTDGGLYFGPYPNVSTVKKLLRTFWRKKIFALRPCRYDLAAADCRSEETLKAARAALYKKVRSCIYLHTGECPAPCVGRVSPSGYARIVRRAESFFKGGMRPLMEKWRRGMEKAARSLDYERAGELRDQLAALAHLAENVTVREMDESLLERHTERSRGLSELQAALALPSPPLRIEAFDISNIQGTEPVASLVVFRRGEPDKSEYRKFKIKTVRGANDFAMMEEAVGRRYRRLLAEGKELPGLVLIDGGKGQLAAAQKAISPLAKQGLKRLELAALAKEEEEIYRPGKSEPIRLPKDSPALHILQWIRDEAHRFAVSFHRQRRGKAIFTSGKEQRAVSGK